MVLSEWFLKERKQQKEQKEAWVVALSFYIPTLDEYVQN